MRDEKGMVFFSSLIPSEESSLIPDETAERETKVDSELEYLLMSKGEAQPP